MKLNPQKYRKSSVLELRPIRKFIMRRMLVMEGAVDRYLFRSVRPRYDILPWSSSLVSVEHPSWEGYRTQSLRRP